MNKKSVLSLLVICSLLSSARLSAAASDYRYYNEIGMLGGKLNTATTSETEIEGFVGSNGVAVQKEIKNDTKLLAQYVYGRYDFQLEAGSGFGIAGHGLPWMASNIGLTSYEKKDGFHLHIGLEPFYGIYSANANATIEDYIEWQPMPSLGFRMLQGNFRWLLLGKIGGSIGTLSGGGSRLAYGGASYIIYKNFDMSVEMSRIDDKIAAVELWDFDLSDRANLQYSLGRHARGIFTRTSGNSSSIVSWVDRGDLSEYRFYMSLRFSPVSFIPMNETQDV